MFQVDHRRKYEFSIWILSTGTDITNYLGFFVYDKRKKHLDSGSVNFKNSNNDPAEWKRWNGLVLPPSRLDDPNRPANDVPSYFSNGEDWKWPANAVYAVLRFGSCYGDGDNSGITFFALTQVVESDFQL